MVYTFRKKDILMPAGRVRDLVDHVERSLDEAIAGRSRITSDVLALEGFSGHMSRHFYNNICSLAPLATAKKTKYLEIGTWQGSSLISAMYANKHVHATVIDNWSQFGGPKAEFLDNVERLTPSSESTIDVLDMDCFSPGIEKLIQTDYDIYLFDGEHTEEAQCKAMTHYARSLNSQGAIVMVDDWNWSNVRNGTKRGLQEAGLNVEYMHEIRHTMDDSHTDGGTAKMQFWNGICIFVLKGVAPPATLL